MAAMLLATGGLGLLQIANGLNQAATMRDQAELNGIIGEMNAEYAEIDAWEAEQFGFTQSARYQSVIDKTIGAQRVAFASQGVDVTTGTARDVQEETKLTGFLNQLDLQKQARAKSYGYKVQASNLRLGNFMTQMQASAQASATETSAVLGGVSTALSGYRFSGKPTGGDSITTSGSSGYIGGSPNQRLRP